MKAEKASMINVGGGAATFYAVSAFAAPKIAARLGHTMPTWMSLGIGAAVGYGVYQLLGHTIGKDASPIPDSAKVANQDALVNAARDVMKASPTASAVLKQMDDMGVQIRVVPDDVFYRVQPDHAGATYDDKANAIIAPEGQMQDPTTVARILTHEGTHAIDFHHNHGMAIKGPGKIWGGLKGTADAALHLDNPVTGFIDGMWRAGAITEANAYLAEAKASQELIGHPDNSFASDEQGHLRSRDETLDQVLKNDLYALDGPRRWFFEIPAGVMLGSFGSLALGAVLSKVGVPKSGLVGGALAGTAAVGLIAQDIVSHPNQG
jgi:hypothetical protein